MRPGPQRGLADGRSPRSARLRFSASSCELGSLRALSVPSYREHSSARLQRSYSAVRSGAFMRRRGSGGRGRLARRASSAAAAGHRAAPAVCSHAPSSVRAGRWRSASASPAADRGAPAAPRSSSPSMICIWSAEALGPRLAQHGDVLEPALSSHDNFQREHRVLLGPLVRALEALGPSRAAAGGIGKVEALAVQGRGNDTHHRAQRVGPFLRREMHHGQHDGDADHGRDGGAEAGVASCMSENITRTRPSSDAASPPSGG